MVKLATAIILLATAPIAFASDPPSQPALAWSVTIGGSGNDAPRAAAVDDAGYIYVAGTTDSADFPVTPDAAQTVFRGTTDAFVVKLTPDGKRVVYATYLGGRGTEFVTGLGVDGAGNAYVAVQSTSTDYPNASSACANLSQCGYITKVSSDGRSVAYAIPVPLDPFVGYSFQLGRVVASENGTAYVEWQRTVYCGEQTISVVPPEGNSVSDFTAAGGNCDGNVHSHLNAFASDPANGILDAYSGLGQWVERIGTTRVREWRAASGSAPAEAVTSDNAGGAYVLGRNLVHVSADGAVDSTVPMQVPQDWWTLGSSFDEPFRQDASGRLHAVLCGSSCRATTIDPTGAVTGSTIIAGGATWWAYGYGPLGQLVAAGGGAGDVAISLYGDAVITDVAGATTVRFNTGITWTAQRIRADAEYKFIRRDPDGVWSVVRDWSGVPTYTWFPTYSDLGVHDVQVWLRTPGSTAMYEDYRSAQVTVTDAPLPIIEDLIPSASSYHVGAPVTWTAHAAGGYGVPQFAFVRLDSDGWHLAQPYSSDNSYTWIPGPADLGSHALQVWVRNRDSEAQYEDWQGTAFTVGAPAPLAAQLVALDSIPAADTRAITWRALTTGGTGPLQFQFWRLSPGGTWSMVQDYSTRDTYTWRPDVNDAGTYAIQVWVRNAGSTAAYDAWAGTGGFTVPPPAALTLTVTSQPPAPLTVGAFVSWNVVTSTPTGTFVDYSYVRLDADGWHVVSPYGYPGSGAYSWMPAAQDVGPHELQVWARRYGSTAPFEGWIDLGEFDVVPPPDVVLSASGVPHVGVTTTWTAAPTSISPVGLTYTFIRLDDDGWHVVQDGSSASYSWTPTDADAGVHALQVWIHVPGSTALYDGWATVSFTVATLPPPVVQIEQLGPMPAAGIGGTVAWKATATGAGAPYQYKFVRFDDGAGWQVVQDFSSNDTYVWSPGDADAAGEHVVQVWVRNAGSNALYDGWATTGSFLVYPPQVWFL